MFGLSRLSLRTKLSLLMGLAAIGVTIAVAVGAATMQQRMYDDRIDKLRAVVQSARSYAASLQAQVSAGKLTYDQALESMRQYGHAMRFDHGDGYLTLSGMDGVIRVHGADPNRENKPSTAASADGKTVPELAAEVLKGGADDGVISYYFAKPGQTALLSKVAYVARFAPWQSYLLAGAYTDDLEAEFHAALLRQGGIGALILVFITLVAWRINRDIAGGLTTLGAAMHRLSGGDLAHAVPGLSRSDELGVMAKSVQIFKEHMIDANHLRDDQDIQKQHAETQRRQAMQELAAKFEASVGGIVESVAAAATQLQSTAQSMAATSGETTRQSATVAEASELATQNVQTVAAATEQLSASIREIAQQVTRASAMIQESVRQATMSNEQVRGLTAAADKIGDVVSIISDIAGQTNLLALNATIEAARAGDAGKGFAVVASEVKALANQTARATDEIASQIKTIQEATQTSARFISGIAETIGKVHETASSIASAVEEQGLATQEISRNVLEAARGTQVVSGNISSVSEAAQQTGAAATQVLASASELSQNGATLRAHVAGFLREVRAA